MFVYTFDGTDWPLHTVSAGTLVQGAARSKCSWDLFIMLTFRCFLLPPVQALALKNPVRTQKTTFLVEKDKLRKKLEVRTSTATLYCLGMVGGKSVISKLDADEDVWSRQRWVRKRKLSGAMRIWAVTLQYLRRSPSSSLLDYIHRVIPACRQNQFNILLNSVIVTTLWKCNIASMCQCVSWDIVWAGAKFLLTANHHSL
jgi:predicted  nucleic acid-binding Zn ribbon protein